MRHRVTASANVRSAELSAIVTKPDGTTIEYGVVAYGNRNPLKHLIGNVRVSIFRWLGRVRVRVTPPNGTPRMEWRPILRPPSGV